MIYQFEREPVSGVIFVNILLDEKYKLKMVLDPAASRTTLDINALHLADYPIGEIIEKDMVETSSGIMEVNIIKANTIFAFGHTVHGTAVQIYDFLAHGILSDYDGLLGIDFFENTAFRVDMNNQTVEIEEYIKPR